MLHCDKHQQLVEDPYRGLKYNLLKTNIKNGQLIKEPCTLWAFVRQTTTFILSILIC